MEAWRSGGVLWVSDTEAWRRHRGIEASRHRGIEVWRRAAGVVTWRYGDKENWRHATGIGTWMSGVIGL
jgi:hypothetical protein